MSGAAMLEQPLMPLLQLDESPAPPRPRRVPVRAHLRRVTGPAVPSGAELRDSALLQLEAKQAVQAAVAYVRPKLVALYQERAARDPEGAFVTADDVERILREWHRCPDEAKAEHGPQHWRGLVFRAKGWRQTGRTVPSLRPHMRATQLPAWRYTDPSNPSTEAQS